MQSIKSQIKVLIDRHGSKEKAKKASEIWYKTALKSFADKSVAKSSSIRFTPGKIYVFRYDTPITEDRLEWWDKNPVVLALDPYKGNDVGINLNLLPVDIKETLLDLVYSRMQGQIKTNEMRAPKNANAQQGLSLSYKGAKGFLDQYGVGFAIRQYIPNLKTKQATVSYENWADIILCDFIELNGTTIGAIKTLFRKYYNNKNI